MTIDIIYDNLNGLVQVPSEGSGSVSIYGDLLVSNNFILDGTLVTSDSIESGSMAADDLVILSASFEELSSSYVLTSGTVDLISASLDPIVAGVVPVFELSDLPTSVNGIITLAPFTLYEINAQIDLGTDTLTGFNTNLQGKGSFQTSITTSSTGSLFSNSISSSFSFFSGLAINNAVGKIFDVHLDTDPFSSFVVRDCFINSGNTGSIGTVLGGITQRYSEVNFSNFVNGLEISGSIGDFSTINVLFNTAIGTTSLYSLSFASDVSSDAIILNNVNYKTSNSGDTALSIDSAIVLPEPIRLTDCSFRGSGSAIDTSGITSSDPELLVENCSGVSDSVFVGSMFFNGNTDLTTVLTQSQTINIGEGTPAHTLFTTGTVNSRFSISGSETQNQSLVYNGLLERSFQIVVDTEMDKGGGGSLVIELCILKNDIIILDSVKETEVSNASTYVATSTFINLSTGDNIKACVANTTDTTDFTIKSMKIRISKL